MAQEANQDLTGAFVNSFSFAKTADSFHVSFYYQPPVKKGDQTEQFLVKRVVFSLTSAEIFLDNFQRLLRQPPDEQIYLR